MGMCGGDVCVGDVWVYVCVGGCVGMCGDVWVLCTSMCIHMCGIMCACHIHTVLCNISLMNAIRRSRRFISANYVLGRMSWNM